MLTASINNPDLEKMVQAKLQSGEFRSVDEIVAAGLAMLAEDPDAMMPPEEMKELQDQLAVGLAQADRGEVAPWNKDEILQELQKRMKK